MKKIVMMAAVMVMVAGGAFAQNSDQVQGKDLCLLNSEGCQGEVYSITEIMGKLQSEISKGKTAYNDRELAMLASKLQQYEEYYRLLAYE